MILPRHGRVVLWGLAGETGDSFKHIWRHYAHALDRLDKPWIWLPDRHEARDYVTDGDLLFAVDVDAANLGTPIDGVDYVLHNILDSHPVRQGLDPERHIYLQVWTNDCAERGEAWGPVRRWDRHSRVLYQPWGTDLLPDEFLEPVFNGDSRTVEFVGSVWEGNGQGNQAQINEVGRVSVLRGLEFRHHVRVSDLENVMIVRSARIAPAVAGQWQVDNNYLPCRVFKNISYGQLGVTNVPMFSVLFGEAAVVEQDIPTLMERTVNLTEHDWLGLVEAQQEIVREYTYRQSLEAISRAFDA